MMNEDQKNWNEMAKTMMQKEQTKPIKQIYTKTLISQSDIQYL